MFTWWSVYTPSEISLSAKCFTSGSLKMIWYTLFGIMFTSAHVSKQTLKYLWWPGVVWSYKGCWWLDVSSLGPCFLLGWSLTSFDTVWNCHHFRSPHPLLLQFDDYVPSPQHWFDKHCLVWGFHFKNDVALLVSNFFANWHTLLAGYWSRSAQPSFKVFDMNSLFFR